MRVKKLPFRQKFLSIDFECCYFKPCNDRHAIIFKIQKKDLSTQKVAQDNTKPNEDDLLANSSVTHSKCYCHNRNTFVLMTYLTTVHKLEFFRMGMACLYLIGKL